MESRVDGKVTVVPVSRSWLIIEQQLLRWSELSQPCWKAQAIKIHISWRHFPSAKNLLQLCLSNINIYADGSGSILQFDSLWNTYSCRPPHHLSASLYILIENIINRTTAWHKDFYLNLDSTTGRSYCYCQQLTCFWIVFVFLVDIRCADSFWSIKRSRKECTFQVEIFPLSCLLSLTEHTNEPVMLLRHWLLKA